MISLFSSSFWKKSSFLKLASSLPWRVSTPLRQVLQLAHHRPIHLQSLFSYQINWPLVSVLKELHHHYFWLQDFPQHLLFVPFKPIYLSLRSFRWDLIHQGHQTLFLISHWRQFLYHLSQPRRQLGHWMTLIAVPEILTHPLRPGILPRLFLIDAYA